MTTESSEMRPPLTSRVGAWLLAIVLPLLILWGYAQVLELDRVPEKSDAALDIEAELAEARPDVLLLGSSQLGRGVKTDLLAQELGTEKRVHSLWRSSMKAPPLYAILKNRVLAEGHTPEVVLLVATLDRFMTVDMENDARTVLLREQMGEYEPAISQKVFGRERAHPMVGLAQQRRSTLQQDLMGSLKGWTVATFFRDSLPEGDTPAAGRGRVLADESAERLFGGEEARDMEAHKRAIPITDVLVEGTGRSRDARAGVEASLIPDFVALAGDHEFKLVLVVAPLATPNPTPLDEDTQRELYRYLNDNGVGLIDLSEMDLKRSDFMDPAHLNQRGARLFTKALAERMLEMDILDASVAVPEVELSAQLAGDLTWTRTGTPPEVSLGAPRRLEKTACGLALALGDWSFLSDPILKSRDLGRTSPLQVLGEDTPLQPSQDPDEFAERCAGAYATARGAIRFSALDDADAAGRYRARLNPEPRFDTADGKAVWVYPGTAVQVAFASVPPGERHQVRLAARAASTASGVPELVLPTGAAFPVPAQGLSHVLEQDIAALPAEGSVLTIRSPEDGPYLLLTSLALRGEAETLELHGKDPDGSLLEAAGGTSLGNKRLLVRAWDGTEFRFLKEPRPVTGLDAPVKIKGDVGRINAPDLAVVSEAAVRARLMRSRVTPIELLEDGAPLEQAPCAEVRKGRAGSFCHFKTAIFFNATDGADVVTGGHRYTARLREDRSAARKGVWVYPGDTLKITSQAHKGGPLLGPARQLRITGAGFGGPPVEDGETNGGEEPLHVWLADSTGTVHLDTTVPLSAWSEGEYTLDLPSPFRPEPLMVLRLQIRDADRYFLMTGAELLD